MDEPILTANCDLAEKIARLVQERGWNMEEFARITGLNRHTVRQIHHSGSPRRLRNATVSACARALGLTVNELRTLALDRLLPRMAEPTRHDSDGLRRLHEQTSQPELLGWVERNPERAGKLSAEELDELLSLQGTGGPLTSFGVEHFVEKLERRRRLVEKVQTVANTEYLELLEQLVELLYEKVQPYRDRA
jgi:transcriptional regulator with XRE-family HTH domain